jgi:hypothetical protein
MPTISMFYGIIVRMYCANAKHEPPHIHVYYQDHTAVYDFIAGKYIKGKLPSKQNKLLSAWCEIHLDDLKADWQLASGGELPLPIDPLR